MIFVSVLEFSGTRHSGVVKKHTRYRFMCKIQDDRHFFKGKKSIYVNIDRIEADSWLCFLS